MIQEKEDKREGHEHGFSHESERQKQDCEPEATTAVFFCVPGVAQERQQGEEGAEDILAFGDPGDGFHVEGVPGEQRGDERAGPQRGSQPEQQEKEQGRIGGVEEDADKVVRPGVEPKERAVSHVGDPGQRMPVARVPGGQRPAEAGPGQPLLDRGIVRDVVVVVVIDEGMRPRRQINQQRGKRKQQGYQART